MSTQIYLENSKSIQKAQHILKDLFQPKTYIFWLDLLLSTMIGWFFFTLACLAEPLSWSMFIVLIVSALALYRSLFFVHEISHLKSNAPAGFILSKKLKTNTIKFGT